jgi:predicted nucleotidyltransferase component of viral defense system
MTKKSLQNLPASIKARLLQLAKQRGEDFNYLLGRYAAERLLYRLGQSSAEERFILKGATLFSIWNDEPHRATKDLDLLAHGNNETSFWEEVFREICRMAVDEDGMVFLEATVRAEKIKQEQEYEGVRIKLVGQLAGTKISVQVDLGFGDAITPKAEKAEFPSLLNLPTASLLVYPRETVIAEKFQAMVALGIINSRLKDFYDIWFLCQHFEFQGELLGSAFKNTFNRRRTSLPTTLPLALTSEFAEDKDKQKQWMAFINKGQLKAERVSLPEAIAAIGEFLMPPCLAVAEERGFPKTWTPSKRWSEFE